MSDKEQRVGAAPAEENGSGTEQEEEEMEGSGKIRFRQHVAWKKVGEIHQDSRSQEEIEAMMLEIARDLLKPWIPQYLESHNKNDTDLYAWKRKTFYTTAKGVSVAVYRCPLHGSCACRSLLRVKRSDGVVIMEICHEHTPNSHKHSVAKKLSPAQKDAIITAVRGDPGVSSTGIRRHCEPTAPISVALQRCVQRLVHTERVCTMQRELGGVVGAVVHHCSRKVNIFLL